MKLMPGLGTSTAIDAIAGRAVNCVWQNLMTALAVLNFPRLLSISILPPTTRINHTLGHTFYTITSSSTWQEPSFHQFVEDTLFTLELN